MGYFSSTLCEVSLIDWDKIWWGICRSIMQIIDWIGQAFDFIIGANRVTEADGTQTVNNIFESLFSSSETNIGVAYWGIALACVVLMGAFIAIGAIKAQFTEDVPKSLGKMGGKAFGGVLKIIAMPLIFWLGLMAVGVIFTFLIDVMSLGSSSGSIAQQICDACNQTGSQIYYYHQYAEVQGRLSSDTGEFQYLLCILSGSFLIVTLTTCCISLTKRFIEVFFYYLVAPIAIARAPIDDGKSFDLWKENTVAKLLGAGGIIIAMYLYYKIMPAFINTVKDSGLFLQNGQAGTTNVVGNIIIIMFLIGGSAVPASASMMFAQLISQGAGQNEANNMMHTQQMMGNAFRMANAITGKALAGSLLSAGGGAASGAARAIGGGLSSLNAGADGGNRGSTLQSASPMAGAFNNPIGGGGGADGGAGPVGGGGAPLGTGPVGGAPLGVGLAAPVAAGGVAAAVSGGFGQNAGGGADGGAGPVGGGGGMGLAPIKSKGYRQTVRDQLNKAKQIGRNNPSLAYLGLGGLIGAFATRAIARLAAPAIGSVKFGLNKAKNLIETTRPGIKAKTKLDSYRVSRSQAADRRSANATVRELAHKDKKWNAAMDEGGATANTRMNKELDDLQNRVAKWDKKYDNLRQTNPEQFGAFRQQQFGKQYDTVNRRLTGQLGNNNQSVSNAANEGLHRLNNIANGTYNTPTNDADNGGNAQ